MLPSSLLIQEFITCVATLAAIAAIATQWRHLGYFMQALSLFSVGFFLLRTGFSYSTASGMFLVAAGSYGVAVDAFPDQDAGLLLSRNSVICALFGVHLLADLQAVGLNGPGRVVCSQ